MSTLLHRRPSPAMVVACIALAIALGGTSYAAISLPANSVGTKQLKKNAVKRSKIAAKAVDGSKVAADSLTGANILESSLGTVPSATNATNAAHATSADSATNAAHATNADHATTADSVPALSWTDLTLKNSWAAFFEGVPQIAKSSEGVVYFRGAMTRTSGTSTNPFAVPAGFVPSTTHYIPVDQVSGTTGRIRVEVSGEVFVEDDPDHPGSAGTTHLTGVSYTLPY
jgi:hypothetical protein